MFHFFFQTKWKDLQTDLMLVPVGLVPSFSASMHICSFNKLLFHLSLNIFNICCSLNPERIGGDFKEEVQVCFKLWRCVPFTELFLNAAMDIAGP